MDRRLNFKSMAFHILVPIMLLFIVMMLIPDYTVYYDSLRKYFPHLSQMVFIIIYGLMYLMMGIAGYLVEEADGKKEEKQSAFNSYYLQLLINLLWLPILFGFRHLLFGFIWILFLLVMVFVTYRKFMKISIRAGYLLLVYLLITLFFTYYTLGLYLLNR